MERVVFIFSLWVNLSVSLHCVISCPLLKLEATVQEQEEPNHRDMGHTVV